MATFTALFDACVLYPAPLRDLIVSFAAAGMYRARWSEKIHQEWIEAVLTNRQDIQRATLERTKELMNTVVFGSVVTGYESLVDSLVLPDPDDRHVLAAAIKTRANVIVTFNLGDFPAAVIEPFWDRTAASGRLCHQSV